MWHVELAILPFWYRLLISPQYFLGLDAFLPVRSGFPLDVPLLQVEYGSSETIRCLVQSFLMTVRGLTGRLQGFLQWFQVRPVLIRVRDLRVHFVTPVWLQ